MGTETWDGLRNIQCVRRERRACGLPPAVETHRPARKAVPGAGHSGRGAAEGFPHLGLWSELPRVRDLEGCGARPLPLISLLPVVFYGKSCLQRKYSSDIGLANVAEASTEGACSPHGGLGPGGQSPAQMADLGLLTCISKVVPIHLLEKQTHSLWLLLPLS